LYRLSFGLRQDAAEGHANYKHHGKQHSNYAVISWRAQPSHLLVQEFLIASVHFDVPILSVRNAAKLPLFPLTVAELTLSSFIGGALSLPNGGVGHQFKTMKHQSA
jgi:hypothetical protein